MAARHIRRSAMDAIKKRKADIPLDEFKRLEKEIQKFTDATIDNIDRAAEDKARSIAKD